MQDRLQAHMPGAAMETAVLGRRALLEFTEAPVKGRDIGVSAGESDGGYRGLGILEQRLRGLNAQEA